MKIFNNILKSYKHIPYTYKHIKAFNRLQRETFGKVIFHFHDWDKIVMYILIPFMGTKRIKKIHKKISKHHLTRDSDYDCKNKVLEALIDWECARFTKPDKPENAYDTIHKGQRTYKQKFILVHNLTALNWLNTEIYLNSL